MNLTISKDSLIRGLQTVMGAVTGRTTLPILSNVLLKADEKDRLELVASDLDLFINCTVEATVKKGGAATVPIKRLFALVRELASEEIELEVDSKHNCAVRAGSTFFKLHGLHPDEFPKLPTFKAQGITTLPQEAARDMLRKTTFCMSTDESRYALQGVLLIGKGTTLTAVATDGRRLSVVETARDGEGDCEIIVPARAAQELHRLLADTGTMEVRHGKDLAAFTLKPEKGFETYMVTRLIDGKFPNHRKVIPEKSDARIGLVRWEFLHALRLADCVTSNGSDSIKLTVSKNNLAITANSPEIGEVRESMAINYKGPDIAIAFAARFLIDPLNALASDEIFLELTDDKSAGVIRSRDNFLHVLMPMRLS